MADLFRILVAFFALYAQMLSRGPVFTIPTPRPTATLTSTPPPSATRTSTPRDTATPTASPSTTRTSTAVPTNTSAPPATATFPSVVQDPTGFEVVGVPPAQKLPSALLVYPLIRTSANEDTLIELMNLTGSLVSVRCFFVTSVTCNEIGFSLTLTANQPAAWNASTGSTSNGRRVAPAFLGEGELKCAVMPGSSDLNSHNALQGRAIVQNSTGQTIGYNAIAFRRLSPGNFTGSIQLDGVTYEQCPDRLHFTALTNQTGTSDSELVLVPCSEDLLNQVAATTTVQFAVINELEQNFSGSINVNCFSRRSFSSIPALRRNAVGTDTVHLIVRPIDVPVIGLVIDRFNAGSGMSVSSNSPYLEGGRAAEVTLP